MTSRDSIDRLRSTIAGAIRGWGGQSAAEDRALMTHIDAAIEQWIKSETAMSRRKGEVRR